nr:hypothetical protein [Streptomyces hygroscopicus]
MAAGVPSGEEASGQRAVGGDGHRVSGGQVQMVRVGLDQPGLRGWLGAPGQAPQRCGDLGDRTLCLASVDGPLTQPTGGPVGGADAVSVAVADRAVGGVGDLVDADVGVVAVQDQDDGDAEALTAAAGMLEDRLGAQIAALRAGRVQAGLGDDVHTVEFGGVQPGGDQRLGVEHAVVARPVGGRGVDQPAAELVVGVEELVGTGRGQGRAAELEGPQRRRAADRVQRYPAGRRHGESRRQHGLGDHREAPAVAQVRKRCWRVSASACSSGRFSMGP